MEGATTNVQVTNEPSKIRGTGTGTGHSGHSTRPPKTAGAFRIGGGVGSRSTNGPRGLDAESGGLADDSHADSDRGIQGGDGANPKPVRDDRGRFIPGGGPQSGSPRPSGSPDTKRRGPGRPVGWRKHPELDSEQAPTYADHQEDSFQVTVESEAYAPGEPRPVEGGKVEKPPSRSHKKQTVAKSKIDELADSVKDIYSIMDSLMGTLVMFTGRIYPDGLFCISDDIAFKLAKNLLIVNSSVPRVGQQVSKVAAPILLLTTFLGDISTKGLVLYGIFKSPKPNHGLVSPPKE